MQRTIALALIATLSACSDEADGPQITVPFPQVAAEQALHCMRILPLHDQRFAEVARDSLPDTFAATVSERESERIAAAAQSASRAAMDAGAITLAEVLDTEAQMQAIRSVIASFNEDGREFSRHIETCVNLYAPAGIPQ